ncbi:MAG: hypothetical protein AAF675_13800 [Pseudomonadota bacterium]
MKIAIAACAAYPQLSPSNACLRDSLAQQGADVVVLSWNRDPMAAFLAADVTILRQTWDYQADPGGFAAWAVRLEALGGCLEAPAALAVWNNDKRSLIELGAFGLPIPRTIALSGAPDEDPFSQLAGERIVLKPAFGGSGVGVQLTDRQNYETALEALRAEAPGRPVMAQEFLPEIADGEWKMTCIEGRVALTVRAVPRPNEFRINARYGPEIRLEDPPTVAITAAEAVLAKVGTPLCARVDGIMRDGQFFCTEIEITDPDLHLHYAPTVADGLAEAIIRRVERHSAA